MNILFVCTGNTCRSPLAEAILKNKNEKNINVKSVGVFATEGANTSWQANEVLRENDIHFDHQSKMLTVEDVEWATYIFTMTKDHKELLINEIPQAADKAYTLKEFVLERNENIDVPDPFGGSIDLYRETFNELQTLIEQMLEKLRRNDSLYNN